MFNGANGLAATMWGPHITSCFIIPIRHSSRPTSDLHQLCSHGRFTLHVIFRFRVSGGSKIGPIHMGCFDSEAANLVDLGRCPLVRTQRVSFMCTQARSWDHCDHCAPTKSSLVSHVANQWDTSLNKLNNVVWNLSWSTLLSTSKMWWDGPPRR